MAAQPDAIAALTVDDAITRVLAAEQSARAAVEACGADAEAIRKAARDRAHAIAERAAERAAAVHRWTDNAIRTRIEALNRERAALREPSAPPPDEPARIARALERLAEELSGSG